MNTRGDVTRPPAEEHNGTDFPLRICLLTYRGKPTSGGQGVYIKRLSRALADLGHRVDVISGPPYPELDPDIRLIQLPSLDLYNQDDLFRVPKLSELRSAVNLLEWLSVSLGGFPEPLTFSLRAYAYLKAHAGDYDIVHDNQCLGYGLLALKRLGLATVATIHHPITVDRDLELASEKWWWRRLKVRRWYAFLGMQAQVARHIGPLITVSQASQRDIAAAFGVPRERFRVVANGINTDIFHPEPTIERLANEIMVTNSADTPLKGLRFLIEAISILSKEREIRLTVIGKPKKDSVIERLVTELDLRHRVTFTGRIEDREFPIYYARATLAVVPSLYEGFGLPAGEAMACGVPVISTTGGALPEVVGDAGILVPPGDARALAEAIRDLLDQPHKRDQLGRAGYARVLEQFTWRNTATNVVQIYREALKC